MVLKIKNAINQLKDVGLLYNNLSKHFTTKGKGKGKVQFK